jgi:hypothetical protein
MRPSTRLAHQHFAREIRRAIEALVPYATHRAGCEAFRGDRKPCTCGLAERLAAAQRLCIPNSPPADYTPRRYG